MSRIMNISYNRLAVEEKMGGYDHIPDDSKERKYYPITRGVLDYFPLAIAEIARVSYIGNEKHNPGEPLHWAREKSTDHADALGRHLIDRGKISADGLRHTAQLAWRALALLELELEAARGEASREGIDEEGPADGAEQEEDKGTAPRMLLM